MGPSLPKKRARHIVTGAGGLIGFELVRQLLVEDDEVLAVDVFKKGGRSDLEKLADRHAGALVIVETDLASDSNALASISSQWGGPVDTIFHFAAILGVRYVTDHPYETVRVNMRSTLNMLDYAQAHGCSAFMFASSCENYASGVDAGQIPVPTPENVALSISDIELPRWSYAASKICGEAAIFGAAHAAGFTPVILRFHNVYGPRMGPTHVIPEMLARCRAKVNPFPIFGADQTRSFLYVEDAGRALMHILRAAPHEHGGIYNIGSAVETTIMDVARIIFELTGHRPELNIKPAPSGSVQRRVPNVAKLIKLNFEPQVALADGIRACWKR
jgi:nucleoside-diphosphate-sugar epimerase